MDTSFTNSTSGFVSKGMPGTTNSIHLENDDLVVTAKEEYGGARKTITTNATAGDRFKIKLAVDRGNTSSVRLFMSEGGDPNTPGWTEYLIGYLQPGIQDFEFIHTVTETGSLSITLDKIINGKEVPITTNFKLLNAKFEKIYYKIIEADNYYPFGLKHTGYNIAVNGGNDKAQKYKYNGKELQDELNLNLYDYGARNYDPAIGRWFNVDPLAENSRRWTPYNYCYNNPMRFIDPDGMQGEDIIVTAKDGTNLFTLDDGKKEITKMTAHELYKKGIQWFEPLADNYMPLKTISKGSSSDKLKHFTKEDILEFANEDRWMTSYRQGGSGDWKKVEEGADGYLLVTIDDMPYWADAVGQIPFAVDKVTDEIEDGKSGTEAVKETVDTGKEYGEGKLIGGTRDNSNTYDNYFILRGALSGSRNRDITLPITQYEKKKYGL